MMDFAGATRYAEYSTFAVGSRDTGYKLTVGGYTGDAGLDGIYKILFGTYPPQSYLNTYKTKNNYRF